MDVTTSQIIRAAEDVEIYLGWSTVVEAPTWVAEGREAALQCPDVTSKRIERADVFGTSVLWEVAGFPKEGSWEDTDGLIYLQEGFLPRNRMLEAAQRLLVDVDASLSDLLVPLEVDTEEEV